MSIKVLEKIKVFVDRQVNNRPISLIWHGGEPLVTGIDRFKAMLDVFEELRLQGKVDHHVQTNATLITPQWCDLFKAYNVNVGVSIDGPSIATSRRVDWGGKEVFDRIMMGINLLKHAEIPFSAIAVVSEYALNNVEELFDFFNSLGCHRWGINIEEKEGINQDLDNLSPQSVKKFWTELFKLWIANPRIIIREFQNFLDFAQYGLANLDDSWLNQVQEDWFPTIAWNGDVVLLSPEFAGVKSVMYDDFFAGNVLEVELGTIVNNAPGLRYVIDYREGVMSCKSTCRYFAFCRGGQASNKFFENGTLVSTQTNFCLNAKQLLFESIVSVVEGLKTK